MSWLSDLTVVSGGFLTGLALVVGLLWWRVIRRPRKVIGVALAAVASLVLAADLVNAYYSFLPNVSDVADAATMAAPGHLPPVSVQQRLKVGRGGRTYRLAIPDRGSGFGRTDAWLWLPPEYFSDPNLRLPVVYLFHGSPGRPKDWFHGGRAGRIAARLPMPVIVVAPQLSKSWTDDPECVDGVHEKVETHLIRDVIPTVDAQLRTRPDRADRIFAGMSAGGFCALNLGLRHRNLTGTILDLSGETRPTHSGGMRHLFGGDVRSAWANSPDRYATGLPPGPPMRVWLDCGADDHGVLGQLRRIAPVLRADGMTVQLHVRPGGHSYSVWRPALRDGLRWALPN